MGTWTSEGSNTRTISVPKTALNNYVYGDDEHGSSSSSERSFACLKNNLDFQHSFEFETPEWITSPLAVAHTNGNGNYYNLKFNIAANDSAERTGDIIIKCNELTLTLRVVQAGETTPTGFILYMNSDSNYSDTLAAIKVNGNSITPPTSKSILIFTSATPPSTNPNPVNIELLPLLPSSSSETFYLSFNTNTTYNNNNIIYNDFSGEPSPLPSGLSAFKYLTSNNTVLIKVDRNNSVWEDIVDDVSCGLRFYNPADAIYPTINIYISNRLLLVTWQLNYIFVNNTDCQINDILVEIATPDIYGTSGTLENQGTLIDPYDQFGSSTTLCIKRADMDTLFTLDPGPNGKGYKQLHIEAAIGTKPIDLIDVYCGAYKYSLNYLDPFYIYIQ